MSKRTWAALWITAVVMLGAKALIGCGIKLPPIIINPPPSPPPITLPSPPASPSPSPSAEPTPSPSPSSTPTPEPSASPTPQPTPTPPPCVPRPGGVNCQGACELFWQEAIGRKLGTIQGEVHWHPVLQASLLIGHDGPPNHRPCTDPFCREWEPTPQEIARAPRAVDRACNLLKMPERAVVWPPSSGYLGLRCEEVPPVICSPPPSSPPGPSPLPGCPELRCIGNQVHAFQNAQHQSVSYHREGDGGRIYVPNGPVLGGEVFTDSTPYYGGCGPRYSCNGEGAEWGDRCLHCEEKRGFRWEQLDGPSLSCSYFNSPELGDGGALGYGVRCRLSQTGLYQFRACSVSGSVCSTPFYFRVDQ